MVSIDDPLKLIWERERNGCMPRDEVLALMRSDDLEVLHRLWRSVVNSPLMLVSPRLARREKEWFRFHYHARCLVEDRTWRRRSCVREILRWFWDEDEFHHSRVDLHAVRDWLARLYQDGDLELRGVIVSELLGRLFKKAHWRRFFRSWRDNPALAEAFASAEEVGIRDSCEDQIREIMDMAETEGDIPLEWALPLMRSDNPDILAAVYDFVPTTRLEPAIEEDELWSFVSRYFGKCLLEDPITEHGFTRWGVEIEVWTWFQDRSPEEWSTDAKNWLADLYIRGNREAREAIGHALVRILEHEVWRPFFSDWNDDPILKDAYQAALSEWTGAPE